MPLNTLPNKKVVKAKTKYMRNIERIGGVIKKISAEADSK
jgi:hypothetical protein